MTTVKVKDDTAKVAKRAKRAYPATLSSAGAYVRGIAKQSISRKAKKPNPPGKTPNSPTGHLRTAIAFSVIREEKAVVIGPTYTEIGMIGRTHEFGGTEKPKTPPAARQNWRIEIGGYGPIRMDGETAVVGRLNTAAQVERARELAPAAMEAAEVRYMDALMAYWTTGRSKIRHYPARPFMGPALLRAKERLPKMWADSVKGG